ncbi:hypothetical protein [Agrobacterium sp. CG674]
MPYIKLTKASFANLTGQLPGKNFRGVDFKNGVSVKNLPIAVADKFAAQLEGTMLCNASGAVSGPAGSFHRKTTISLPDTDWPRSVGGIAEGADSARVKTIDTLTHDLSIADFGMILDFQVGTKITVPASLPAAFQCALRQGGEDQVEVIAGQDAVLEEIDGKFKSEKRLSVLTLIRFPDGKFQLVGRTA